jgi:hypothetical protein
MVSSDMPEKKSVEDNYSEKEAQARFEAALKGGLNTPPKPLKNKPKVKKAKAKEGTQVPPPPRKLSVRWRLWQQTNGFRSSSSGVHGFESLCMSRPRRKTGLTAA